MGYNILGDNEGIISHLLRIGPTTEGSILLIVKRVALKRRNYEPVLTVKRTEWGKFIDYFGQSVEDNPSRLVKKKIYIFYIGYIPIPSYVKLHISRHHLEKDFNFVTTKYMSVPTNKKYF